MEPVPDLFCTCVTGKVTAKSLASVCLSITIGDPLNVVSLNQGSAAIAML